ncbi:hypothetical protein QR685DRAFT_588069 [Neurospora intermedia]|uniref:Uncharacterized protein n=1 Tax=Neurospora intermedia TaxID=5142 RepID=A0ABR3DEE1_NEUIN
MSSSSEDSQDKVYAQWLALREESVRNVAREEETTTPEQKAQREAECLAWLALRDENDAKKKAPKPRKPRKTAKPPQAPQKETSRKRKRPTADPENGGGQATTASSNDPEGGPPKKRSPGRPKGSKNRPKPGQQQAQAEAAQEPVLPQEPSPVGQQDPVSGSTGSSTDYFGQRLEAAAPSRKTSPPPILQPSLVKASVPSAQFKDQSEPMPDSAERSQGRDQNDDVEDEDDLFGDRYVEMASSWSELRAR